MIKLSPRLQMISSFINGEDHPVDIGCDHALLDIALTASYPKMKIIATDIKEGALNQARINVEKHMMKNRIDLRLGDGLDVITKDEIDTIIISGLGYAKIIDILFKDKSKLINVKKLIIQSNTNHYELRKAICKRGFSIVDEELVKDNNIIYLIIYFVKEKNHYMYEDYLLGPVLKNKKGDLYKEMLTLDINKKEILYNIIPHKYLWKRHRLKSDILVLKSAVR